VLDDARGSERLVLLYSERALPEDEVVRAAERAFLAADRKVQAMGPLALPAIEAALVIEKP
jgi:hypothetical protein